MTTITPTAHVTVPLHVTCTSPLHHGAGNSGNTALLRTQDVAQPDGTTARVPFVSGASVRHHLRDALAWHLVRTLDLPDGSLTKGAVDLLWSGGAVTTTGAQVDLGMSRRVEEHLPMLGLLGYAAQSDIVTGTLRASDLILVCAENAWRLPDGVYPPVMTGRRAAAYRTEEFGTRHDVASTPVDRFVDLATDLPARTTQMIFDRQVLMAGAMLHGNLTLTPAATDVHRTWLLAALALWAPDGHTHLGASAAQGYGAVNVPIPGDAPAALDTVTTHIHDHATDITTLIGDLTR